MKKFILYLEIVVLVFMLCACGKKVQLEVPLQQEIGDGVVECTLYYGEKEYFYLTFKNQTSYPLGLHDDGVLYQWTDEKWKEVSLPELKDADGTIGIRTYLMEGVTEGKEKTVDAVWGVDVKQLSLEKGTYKLTYSIQWDGWIEEEWVKDEMKLTFEFEILE